MKYILFFSLLTFSFSVLAAPVCSKNGTNVIYTNGVTTERPVAQEAMERVEALVPKSQIDLKPEKVKYILAYNNAESVSRDFLEAAVQRFPAVFLKDNGVINGYAAYMFFKNGGLQNGEGAKKEIYAVAADSIRNKILEILSVWMRDHFNEKLYIDDVGKIQNHYSESLKSGKRVFAISHSQGGLFMSDAFKGISNADKEKYFSGFQIASPLSNEMNSYFGYATHDKDRLINFIRTIAGALPSNVDAPLYVSNTYPGGFIDDGIEFIINHGIVTTYLHDSTIRPQVINELIKTAHLLESNCLQSKIDYEKISDLQIRFSSLENEDQEGISYFWDFGDGKTASTKSFLHTYSVGGTYQVTLTVSDIAGNSVTSQRQVELNSNFRNVTFCHGSVPFISNTRERYSAESTLTVKIEGFSSFSLNAINSSCECKTLRLENDKSYLYTVNSSDIPVNPKEYEGGIIPTNERVRDSKVAGFSWDISSEDPFDPVGDFSISFPAYLEWLPKGEFSSRLALSMFLTEQSKCSEFKYID